MNRKLRTLLVASAMTASASAGDIKVTVIGTVDSNSYNSGPFAGPVQGDTATLTFEVFVPGTDVAPGQLTNYDIDLGTFSLDINGPTGAALAGPTSVQVQNDFPQADGFHFNPTQLATGHFFACGWGATGTLFNSTDITQLLGTYGVAATLTSFGYTIQGQGGQMEIFPDVLIFETTGIGIHICSPMNPNSTGASTSLVGTLLPGSPNSLHLEVENGPPTQFGYLLVGNASSDPGVALGQGRLCLSIAPGDLLGRYNISGGALNSVGAFNASGVMVNLVGTSTSGTGFDVPSTLPLAGSPTIAAGQTWYFQAWHRDAGSYNFSDVLPVTF